MNKIQKTLIAFIVISLIGFGVLVYLFSKENYTRLKQDFLKISNKHQTYESHKLNYLAQDWHFAIKTYKLQKIENKFSNLNKDQKVGRLFMISIPGTKVTRNTTEFINKYQIGGVIIMGGNIESESQLKAFISELRKKSDHELLISVDQEGFPVARVSWEQYATYNGKVLGATNDPKIIQKISKSRAQELNELGFDINFSPVADINYSGSWIGVRSFGSTPQVVAKYVEAAFLGQKDGGIASTAKHFPGLGRTNKDTHELLPTISTSKEKLKQTDWIPFQKLIDSGIEFIMIGHTKYSNLDPNLPATLSKKIQTEILREELGFEGIIITDDMKMGALNGFSNKFSQALKAGSNILLLVDTITNIENAISDTSANTSEEIINEKLRELYTNIEEDTVEKE